MELEARYSECDGTLLYKLQREIKSISQGNLNVTAYYTKLKQLWDELVCLMPPAMCSCGLCIYGCDKTKADQNDRSQLIQFLIGLNESYDNIRNQILVLEPLLNVNKAYSMVLRVERQRQVNSEFTEAINHSAMQVRLYEQRYNTGPKNIMKKKGPIDKRNLFCNHCNKSGHNKETCFKIHGFPDWYKDLNDQRRRQNINNRAYVVDDSEHEPTEKPDAAGNNLVSDLLEALRIVQNKMPQDPLKVHFAQVTEMADNSSFPIPEPISDSFTDTPPTLSQPAEFPNLSESTITPTNTDPSTSTTSSPDIPVPSLILRRSERHTQPPTWLRDFVQTSSDHISSNLASSHSDFQAALSTVQEPRTYNQAKGCVEWELAMQKELSALEQNETWEIVDLPKGKRAIGIDYFDRFSPVAKSVTIRTILAVTSAFEWLIHQSDINNAFLHGFLDEDIYMEAPAGYLVPPGKVCKLKRSLYGLKQASRQWNQEFTTKLVQYGFSQSPHDHCLFTKATTAGLLVILVYVDYLLLTGCLEYLINEVKVYLDDAFTIKDLGYAKYFLGLEIARSSAGTSVTQHKYVRDIIIDAGLEKCRPVSTPLPLGLNLTFHAQPALADPELYRRLVVLLIYLGFTHPDISYGAQQLSQFVHHPSQIHMDAAMHLVRYLKGCPNLGLFFPSSNLLVLKAYCDADWASYVDSRRSLTSYCVFLGNSLIS
ncbi:UNVERIFIED_CONTAM: Retrovirus-related Pol polyprotein from transposon RE1 [Sesamum calycinum]|uniref:Retrovirus-related Pol polyprotein from transposon RE1 n=1 Tax=Sesamum calycinum TaxID=2727403 RepID=A0AAW2MPM4_9LAMI